MNDIVAQPESLFTLNYLQMLLLTPLLGAVVVIAIGKGKDAAVKTTTLLFSILAFAVSLFIAFKFDWENTAQMQFAWSLPWVKQFGLTFGFGIDSISLWLVLLTTFLSPLVILGSYSAVNERVKEFFFWLLVLESAMLGVFVATDIIFFYLCFEFTLIPMYFLIGIFGSSQRLHAARVFFLYTFTGSMLTFAGVLYIAWWYYTQYNAWTFNIASLVAVATDTQLGLSTTQQSWILLAMLAGFAVKVPLFPVHTWLPLAHTEAPTAGSVVLAGVLLKLGTYALLRLAIPMTPEAAVAFAPYIATFAIIGILYTALICWVQKDIKKLIAYSSVSHLGFCVLGMFAFNTWGIGGSVMYMVNHGLSTGALFLCVGMIYERFHTREMKQYGGLAKAMPVWSVFMVYFCLASVGLPGLNGFVGEFLTLFGAFQAKSVLGFWFALFAGIGMIFGAIYLLYMVGKVIFGETKIPETHHEEDSPHSHRIDINKREIITLLPIAVMCLVLGLYPSPVLRSLEQPINQLTIKHQAIIEQLQPEMTTSTPAITINHDTEYHH